MENINCLIEKWGKMTFAENPYGSPIPDKYLYSDALIRKEYRYGKSQQYNNLSEMKQNGYCTEHIIKGRMSDPWEMEETISFTKIFHELCESEKLCPSNYVVEVIRALEQYDKHYLVVHNEEFYIGTIARGLRAFASYVREKSLTDAIDTVLGKMAKMKNVNYQMFNSSVDDDMKKKTDVYFSYNDIRYRCWSYQTTERGIERTGNRIRNAYSGYNVLFPFNFNEKVVLNGWYLYDFAIIRHFVIDLVTMNIKDVQKHSSYCEKMNDNPNIIEKPAVFLV